MPAGWPTHDAFGLIGTTFKELGWKTLIFFERAVPISPNALYPDAWVAVDAVGNGGAARVQPHELAALRARKASGWPKRC